MTGVVADKKNARQVVEREVHSASVVLPGVFFMPAAFYQSSKCPAEPRTSMFFLAYIF